MKSRTHTLKVTVRFDKAITRIEARLEFKDTIHGEHFPSRFQNAETMKIGKVSNVST